jgi:hypothetical protein
MEHKRPCGSPPDEAGGAGELQTMIRFSDSSALSILSASPAASAAMHSYALHPPPFAPKLLPHLYLSPFGWPEVGRPLDP